VDTLRGAECASMASYSGMQRCRNWKPPRKCLGQRHKPEAFQPELANGALGSSEKQFRSKR